MTADVVSPGAIVHFCSTFGRAGREAPTACGRVEQPKPATDVWANVTCQACTVARWIGAFWRERANHFHIVQVRGIRDGLVIVAATMPVATAADFLRDFERVEQRTVWVPADATPKDTQEFGRAAQGGPARYGEQARASKDGPAPTAHDTRALAPRKP